MRALTATGDPKQLVALAEVAEPRPAANELIVGVEAFSINRGETFLLQAPRSGWRPGKDVAGRVIQPAANRAGPAVGTRVVAHTDDSGWAERVAVSVDRVATLPDSLPCAVASALPLAGLTALRLLRVAGPLASQRVLLTGASGGVGHYLVELAALQGAQVTVVTSSPERAAKLLELGATRAVRTIADAAAEGPFAVAMESVGGKDLMAALRAVDPGGLVIWFGQASGEPPRLDFFDWDVPLGVTIHRFGYQGASVSDDGDMATLVRLVASGDLHPEIGLRRDWNHTATALDDLVARRVRGNAVLTIDTPGARS